MSNHVRIFSFQFHFHRTLFSCIKSHDMYKQEIFTHLHVSNSSLLQFTKILDDSSHTLDPKPKINRSLELHGTSDNTSIASSSSRF